MKKQPVILASAVLLVGIFAYGFFEPRSAAGRFTFHAFYLFAPTRPAFLQLYSDILRKTEGGYLPAEIDDFLARQLQKPDSREWRGILDFYLAQGSGRWGECCGKLDDSHKYRITQYFLTSIHTDEPKEQCRKLVFIEYLRRDGNLHKGGFHHGSTWRRDERQRRDVYDMEKTNQAITAFRSWFASSTEWAALKGRDPLADTGLEIGGVE